MFFIFVKLTKLVPLKFWELLGAPNKIVGAPSYFLEFPKYPLAFLRKKGSSAVNVTTVEEKSSSVPSHGRTSFAGSYGRRFFRSCKLQLRKNLFREFLRKNTLLPCHLAEELLSQEATEDLLP